MGVAVLATFASACGSGASTLAEPAACPTPTVSASVESGQGGGQRLRPSRYLTAVQASVVQLTVLYETQRSAWPDRTFSRDAQFRTDFAVYADESVCAAQALIALQAPDSLAARKQAIDAALTAYVTHVQAGREAVRKRNVSEFREWFDGVQQKLQAVKDVASSAPAFGP
jgi:hypothetical protein